MLPNAHGFPEFMSHRSVLAMDIQGFTQGLPLSQSVLYNKVLYNMKENMISKVKMTRTVLVLSIFEKTPGRMEERESEMIYI